MSDDSLIELGVRQGTIISCSSFSDHLKRIVSESRAFIDARRTPVSNEHHLLILSQDCDISNKNVKYVEVIAYKEAGRKDQSGAIQKSRNFSKLSIQNGEEGKFFLLENKFVSFIPKELLVMEMQDNKVDCACCFDSHSFDLVLQWMSSRLIRRPFPHPFNLAFKQVLDNGLGAFLEVHHNNIIEIYAYVSPDDDEATEFDVIIVALLSPDCSEEDKEAIEGTIPRYLTQLAEDNTNMHMLQLNGTAGQILDNVAFVQDASDFIKSDELKLKPYMLNYLCWPDDEAD